jgi:hypothetical protein
LPGALHPPTPSACSSTRQPSQLTGARQEGNITLAKALDITRFEVYESYLDEDYTNN